MVRNGIYGYGEDFILNITDEEKDFSFMRSFYFERPSTEHIRNFAEKFVNDSHYREECISGKVYWEKVSKWYDRNSKIYWDKFKSANIKNKIAEKKT